MKLKVTQLCENLAQVQYKCSINYQITIYSAMTKLHTKNNFTLILITRIFGAYGPIMFALRVWVGFRASWKGGRTAIFFQFQFNYSFMFRRTHGIMFGRTLFEYCVRKDTLHYVRKDIFQNMIDKTFSANSHILTSK